MDANIGIAGGTGQDLVCIDEEAPEGSTVAESAQESSSITISFWEAFGFCDLWALLCDSWAFTAVAWNSAALRSRESGCLTEDAALAAAARVAGCLTEDAAIDAVSARGLGSLSSLSASARTVEAALPGFGDRPLPPRPCGDSCTSLMSRWALMCSVMQRSSSARAPLAVRPKCLHKL